MAPPSTGELTIGGMEAGSFVRPHRAPEHDAFDGARPNQKALAPLRVPPFLRKFII